MPSPRSLQPVSLIMRKDELRQYISQQKRLVKAWPEVMGEMIAGYTQAVYIRNQTLHVKLSNPALRADLSMMRAEIVKKLNTAVGSQVIVEIRFS